MLPYYGDKCCHYTVAQPTTDPDDDPDDPDVDPDPSTNPFTDVRENNYYYDAVLWAVDNDITYGTSATKFSPDNTCTRAQVVTFLYRYDQTTI